MSAHNEKRELDILITQCLCKGIRVLINRFGIILIPVIFHILSYHIPSLNQLINPLNHSKS